MPPRLIPAFFTTSASIPQQIDSSTSNSNYIIPSLHLDDGWFIFSSVSNFLSSITPNDMPLSELASTAPKRTDDCLFTFHCSILYSRAAEGRLSVESFHPEDYPWGKKVNRSFEYRKHYENLFPQALKVESGYICLIVVIFLISILPFCYTIAWCFSRNVKLKVVSGNILQMSSRGASEGGASEERENTRKYHCRKRVYVFILQCFVVLSM